MLFLRLLSGQVYVGSIHGQNGFAGTAGPLSVLIVTLLGTSVLVYALWKSLLELRLFISFSMLLFEAALTTPLISGAQPLWQLLAIDRGGALLVFPDAGVFVVFCYGALRNRKLERSAF